MASGPRRLNWFTALLLLGLAGGGYWFWKFFPVYYTGWQVDHALAEGVAHTYQIAGLAEAARFAAKSEVERTVAAQVAELGVTDPEMTLTIEMTDTTATAQCDYTVVVQHALINKQALVHMHRTATTDLKRVNW